MGKQYIKPDGEVEQLDDAFFKEAKPAVDVLPELVGKQEAEQMLKPKVGRPKSDNPKLPIKIRYDREVIEHFKAKGKGWQTMMNNQLKKDIEEGRV